MPVDNLDQVVVDISVTMEICFNPDERIYYLISHLVLYIYSKLIKLLLSIHYTYYTHYKNIMIQLIVALNYTIYHEIPSLKFHYFVVVN